MREDIFDYLLIRVWIVIGFSANILSTNQNMLYAHTHIDDSYPQQLQAGKLVPFLPTQCFIEQYCTLLRRLMLYCHL